DVIIDACRTQVRTCKSVADGAFGRNWTYVDGAVHENTVADQKILKLFPYTREFVEEFVQFLEYKRAPVALKSAQATHVGRKACTTDFLVDFVDFFAVLEHVQESCERPGIYSEYGVTDNVVSDTGKFHHDDAHVLDPFWNFDAKCFFDRHPPSHVVNRR